MIVGFRRSAVLFLAAVAYLFFLISPLTLAKDRDQPGAAPGSLDGMVFVGRVGPEGRANFDEELNFNNGYFWSKNCITCGYQPSIYWVRNVANGIEFQSELSREDGSRFHYRGRIADGRIEVKVQWTKHRWYWSINKTMTFHGKLEQSRKAVSVEEARRMADKAGKTQMPSWCA